MDEVLRTMSIVNQLAKGKILTLKEGYIIGMAEDMTIGFIITNSNGEEGISLFSELTLRELNKLLNKYEVDYIIKEK
jgi:hypothetical protein